MIQYEKQTVDNKDIFYEILDDGYKIYIGQQSRPSIHQYEPYIPDPAKSYEENAILMCEELSGSRITPIDHTEERLTNIEANIDYLMLLNDPDSESETVAG